MAEIEQVSGYVLDADRVPNVLDEHGRAVWARVVPHLARVGALLATDLESVTRYCELAGRFWKLTKQVRDEGETLMVPTIAKGKDGEAAYMRRRHPSLQTIESLAGECRQMEDRFGLTPKARYELAGKLLGSLRDDEPPPRLPGVDGDQGSDATPDPSRFS